MIKPIETYYAGYRFRSRLEARWAVFFDTLDVRWEYEKEGYDLNGTWYLPDFWLPDLECWIEIKADKPTQEEAEKALHLAEHTNKPVYILYGELSPGWIEVIRTEPTEDDTGIDLRWHGARGDCFWYGDHGCIYWSDTSWVFVDMNHEISIEDVSFWDREGPHATPYLKAAYTAARQARFEHGERGR